MQLDNQDLTSLLDFAVTNFSSDCEKWLVQTQEYAKRMKISSKNVKMAVRYAISARPVGASLADTVRVLGHERTKNRLIEARNLAAES